LRPHRDQREIQLAMRDEDAPRIEPIGGGLPVTAGDVVLVVELDDRVAAFDVGADDVIVGHDKARPDQEPRAIANQTAGRIPQMDPADGSPDSNALSQIIDADQVIAGDDALKNLCRLGAIAGARGDLAPQPPPGAWTCGSRAVLGGGGDLLLEIVFLRALD
jgi:hypothetical protein